VGHEIVAVISRRRLFLLLLLLPIFESMDPSARKKRKKLKWKSIAEEHNYWTAVRENNSENVRTGGEGAGAMEGSTAVSSLLVTRLSST
jgi:hypothetical protein